MAKKPDPIHVARGRRLEAARLAAGFRSARAAALESGWKEQTVRAHENGTRTIGPDDADRYAKRYRSLGAKVTGRDILYGDDEESVADVQQHGSMIPVMGLVGAGAVIDPEHEQVPPEGLFQVETMFPLPEGLIAFQIQGPSMLPKYDPGDVVVCWAEPRRPIETFYGQPAVVRTADGRRYLKKIMRGRAARTVDLHSYDGRDPIENVKLEWIGQIYTIFPASEVNRIEKQYRVAKRRGQKQAAQLR